ncbi:DNA-3-methyladenine glycosylase I [Thermoflavifilum aggregans]|uniref:DNA-3-methyladenine glycosylase I n=1 Tax=Thermoflavifilum aggregans TaxID=454188 RepID=A0A2M9CRS5_9BACT|nr:DNA-3-methyladenine glycosylase I [Thermoflavifilum aggregans]MBX6380210.1 DNA-3-methyladenine glycosylase I [Thermoflavifilum aggregans]PJJ74636.1 DNA-3-methyladenine glycosylase I [Thermoflavifilum aggregans]
MNRCAWPAADPLMIQYHDTEWGVPLHDDRKLFEFLVLDAFQAGLSWRTILYKREHFRKAFDAFDPERIARYNTLKIQQLMHNADIIRNRMKIEATVENARRFLEIRSRYGSFDRFIWQFTDYRTMHHHLQPGQPAPATSPESDAMSKALRAAGFKFVGSTICYAFMQAAGMINDHVVTCFRYSTLKGNTSV